MTSSQWRQCYAAARAGSAAEMGRLLDSFRPYLWIIARDAIDAPLRAKLGGSDLVQESLLNAYRAFDRFRGDSSEDMQAWLRQILRRVVANRWRQFRAERRAAAREVPFDRTDSGRRLGESVADPGGTPSQRAITAEQKRAVDRALRRLPDHYREVIRLRSEERRPFEDIARRTGRMPDGARMLWGRAIRKLQTMLTDAT